MEARTAILTLAVVMMLGFGGLLFASVAESGRFGPLEALSLLILALFGFGVVGALRHPPEE